MTPTLTPVPSMANWFRPTSPRIAGSPWLVTEPALVVKRTGWAVLRSGSAARAGSWRIGTTADAPLANGRTFVAPRAASSPARDAGLPRVYASTATPPPARCSIGSFVLKALAAPAPCVWTNPWKLCQRPISSEPTLASGPCFTSRGSVVLRSVRGSSDSARNAGINRESARLPPRRAASRIGSPRPPPTAGRPSELNWLKRLSREPPPRPPRGPGLPPAVVQGTSNPATAGLRDAGEITPVQRQLQTVSDVLVNGQSVKQRAIAPAAASLM